MLFEVVKQKSKGRIKVFQIDCDLEYLKGRLKTDKDILSVWNIEEGKRGGTPIYWRITKDKILSQSGSWSHMEKYCKQ